MAAAQFRFPHTDKATIVPPAGGTNNQAKSTPGTATRKVREAPLRKILVYFPRPLRIFPQRIPPLPVYNCKNAMKTGSFGAPGNGTELAIV